MFDSELNMVWCVFCGLQQLQWFAWRKYNYTFLTPVFTHSTNMGENLVLNIDLHLFYTFVGVQGSITAFLHLLGLECIAIA